MAVFIFTKNAVKKMIVLCQKCGNGSYLKTQVICFFCFFFSKSAQIFLTLNEIFEGTPYA